MGKFLEAEKPHQTEFKRCSAFFSEAARKDGIYKEGSRPFCLPEDHAEENLIPEARTFAVKWFAKHGIKWHDGKGGNPSNHLCDSQVCGVNFLFTFADKPNSLVLLLKPLYPELKRMVPIEDDAFVSFEWIGRQNYLGERMRPGTNRTRGANFTSADAAVAFEREDGRRQVVLIEWKYTESYHGTPLATSERGTDRTAIYRPLFDKADCPLDKDLLPSFESLFYEPFYQLMRQQFLAHEMEMARELDADIVSVLHIAPAVNEGFCRVTSTGLLSLGNSATGVWKRLVKAADRFQSVSTERLFGALLVKPPVEMVPWADYLKQRYRWVVAG